MTSARQLSSFLLRFSLSFSALPVSKCDTATQPAAWQPCPVWRPSVPRYHYMTEDWDTSKIPFGNDSICLFAKDDKITRDAASITVHFHQTEQPWQQDTQRDEVVSAMRVAIQKSLELFGTHAGTPLEPLQVHATLGSAVAIEGWKYDDGPMDTRAAGAVPGGVASPCYLHFDFPGESGLDYPLRLIRWQKYIVRSLYECVQWYHHPDMVIDYSGPWWRRSTAAFFDSLAWPTPQDQLTLTLGGSSWAHWPEDYQPSWNVDLNGPAAGVLWNYAYTAAGWSLERITNWTRGWACGPKCYELQWSHEEDRGKLAGDKEFCALFQNFGQAFVQGNVTYPGAPWTSETFRETWAPWDWDWQQGLHLEVEQEKEAKIPTIWSWGVQIYHLEVPPGQALNVSMGIPTLKVPNEYEELVPAEVADLNDLAWFYRLAETNDTLVRVDAKPGSTVRISAPDASEATEPLLYEFVMILTSRWFGLQVPFRFKRIS